jgi:heme exporter protein C
MKNLFHLANPARFRRVMRLLLPTALALTLGFLGAGLYAALFASPPDYKQGETVRIMYIHVPAAWMALALYASMAIAAITAFVWRHELADIFCRAAAPVGAALTLLCLITGSLWGKPMWGAWWVWDARLTSMLVLFFLYLGVMALRDAFEDEVRGRKASQLLLVTGLINIPIIKFSVTWWNTLHQGETVFREGGSALHASMITPLALMAGFYVFFVMYITGARMLVILHKTAKDRAKASFRS